MVSRMFRFYSIASLISIVGTAVVMAVLYRAIAVHSIVTVAESNNLVMAEIALGPIRTELADFLSAAASVTGDSARSLQLPVDIDNAVVELMRNPHVKRVKIYNRQGTVIFSTKTDQIGGHQENNEGFVTAIQGRPAAELIYRDTFNVFDAETEEDNLVQSYVPIRRRSTAPVAGVFEVYTDVNALVAETERTQLKIVVLTIVVLAALYGVLLVIVRRSRRIIEAQEQTIREKSAILEELSKRNLRREERERKKVAADLHEGLAQSLTAIKLAVESAREARGAGRGADSLDSVVPALQDAIGQVRTIATDLRPPSLDDLGLTATLNASIREFSTLHPALEIEQDITADEALIPAPLKTIVYRNVEAALRIIGERHAEGDIRISLVTKNRMLILYVVAHGKEAIVSEALSSLATDTHAPLSTVRERTIISGGDLAITRDDPGGIAFRASWPL